MFQVISTRLTATLALLAFVWLGANVFCFRDSDSQVESATEAILSARTSQFDMTVHIKGQPSEQMTAYSMHGRRFRQELEDGRVSITDMNLGRKVLLDPKAKWAAEFVIERAAGNAAAYPNQWELMCGRLREAKLDGSLMTTQLTGGMIGGRPAVGYSVGDGATPLMIWIDTVTGAPVRIEHAMLGPPQAFVVFENLSLDISLDDALFSTDIPIGFDVTPLQVDLSSPTEEAFVKALQILCDASGGRFPPTLDPAEASAIVVNYLREQGVNENNQPDPTKVHEVIQLARGLRFALLLPPEANASYTGRGTCVGDEDRAVFWYRPANSDFYRVIYSDFSVRENAVSPAAAESSAF